MEKIKIQYLDETIEKLCYIDGKSDWIDLRAAEDVTMKSGEFCLIRLGVGMILPEGFEAHLAPRSSTFAKFGIIAANSVGVIDNSFCGEEDEWRMPAIALRDTTIHKGDRIAQGIFIKYLKTDDDDPISRQRISGFGSTNEKKDD